MAYEIGFADNTGDLAHRNFLDKIKTLATANGWTVLRDTATSDNKELILQGVGLSGTEDIFVGFKTYQSVGNDYYNISCAVFTGYVSANSFDAQPGIFATQICAHNVRVDYWLVVNAQRIMAGVKVGTPIYETFYVGKFFQYGRPSEYPYPVVSAGSLTGYPATRYSDTTRNSFYKLSTGAASFGLRNNSGWINPVTRSDTVDGITESSKQLRDTLGYYPLLPIEMWHSTGVYGALDGIYYVSGFNNVVENTLVIGGVTYIVIQNIHRTGFADYIAMRLQ